MAVDDPARRVDPKPGFSGCFDRFEDGCAAGWVVNAAAPLSPVRLHVVVDGQEVAQVLAGDQRDDVQAALNHPTGRTGFSYPIPAPLRDGRDHSLSFRLPGGLVLPYVDPGRPHVRAPAFVFNLRPKAVIRGYVDGLRQGQLQGWVTRTAPGGTVPQGGCLVVVTCDGAQVAQLRADRYRGDAAAAFGGDPNCGFQLTVPQRFRSAQPRHFSFRVMPDDVEIDGSPLLTRTVDDQLEAALLDVTRQMDAMFQDFVRLRRQVAELMPQPGYTLADYDRWARTYLPRLGARVAAERAALASAGVVPDDPLVSILCPTYRPLPADFNAAVESVLAQTYRNWELVIVDDASRQPALTAAIKAFRARDPRIRLVTRRSNGNISAATNTALQAARGVWVAFFDHDDLLVDVALEVMVRAAQRTGARMLYSDEDKIDQGGFYLEPNFKPDWNYRYLLGCNYVCHLLFVERQALAAAGPLDSAYDGAQDHDLVLRLSEGLPAAAIHHVPEVLYHWRKTPGSTAADIAVKGYAVQAGVRAVADHLARRGLAADVASVHGLTIYSPVWRQAASPSVCVVIPFKDQADTTARCLANVLERTEYASVEVILVDNWSVTAEAHAFAAAARAMPRVRVLTVEEPFNFARLNNLAAAQTEAELLLFMNNDLFPQRPDWLRLLVDELLVAPDVAAAGGRFLYPDGRTQHAGVVVGPRGLASHVHAGVPGHEFGYIGRLLLAQDVTAVTAACMLVRAAAFHAVGGFDEVGFKVAYNDVDLCLKLRAAGHRIVYCAEMTAIHHESLSRGSDDRPEHEARFHQEQQLLLERWGGHPLFQHDPAYNPHFTVDRQTFFDLIEPPEP